MKEVTVFNLTHARYEQAFCSAPGLFRSLKRGEQKKCNLNMTYDTPEATFQFLGYEALGVTELRTMQAIIAMAAVSGSDNNTLKLTENTTSELGKTLRETLELKNIAVTQDALVAKGTFYELAKEIGYSLTSFDSGKQTKIIKNSLLRLWAISVYVKYKTNGRENGREAGFRLLSKYENDKDGKFVIGINPRLAEGILGKRKYSRLEMAEIRALKTDPVRFIHQRLCGWIDPGKLGRVCFDTLCEYVWMEQALNIDTIRKRRQYVKKALAELAALGWTVDEYATDKWAITRRGIPN
jgi:hypothetical protein